jgi:hypothetical protein
MNPCSHNNHICEVCNKQYSNRQNLWRHKKIHTENQRKSIISQTGNFGSHIPVIVSHKTAISDLQEDSNVIIEKIGYSCEFCGTIYTHRQSKYKHQIKCREKTNKNIILKNQLLENEKENNIKTIDNLQKQLDDVKKTLIEIINKNCKVHPKTLQKINKQLNGDNNTINENNITNNNNITYNIIGFGHENLSDIFSKKEKLYILKHKYCSLPYLVEYAHFNDKYPQLKNILITNTQNNLAYKYDIKKKQFIAINKDELLEDIVDARMCDIGSLSKKSLDFLDNLAEEKVKTFSPGSFYEELEDELDTKTKDILDKVKEKIDSDPAYKELKKQDIKLILYNNRKKVIKENISKTLK